MSGTARNRRILRWAAVGLLGALARGAAAQTASAPPGPGRELAVGIFAAPPWSMKDAGGQWHGLTVDLWKDLAADLDYRYRFVESGPDAILDQINQGTLDTAAGPYAATVEREREVDFSHAYALSGIGIAILRARDEDRWLAVVEALSTPTALRLYTGIVLLVFLAGAALWLLERRRNAMFAGRALQGIGSGFWWAGVTTVGVGYGDKVPITFWGRLVGLFWMFVSLILITSFTAFVTTKLAFFDVARIQGPGELRHAVIGTVEGSASVDLLRREDLTHRVYPNVPAAIEALVARDVQAVVYGSVVLRYYADRDPGRRIEVLPGRLEAFNFAFPLKDGSPLRDPLNGALRRVLNESHWNDLKNRYLGRDVAEGMGQ